MSDRANPNILIVDGSGAVIDDLKRCLEGHFVVESAATCEAAITVLHGGKDVFSIVMLCCPLADMSTEAALDRITSDSLLMHVPVIILSEDRVEGVRALYHGAMDFIDMAFHMPEMVLARTRHAVEVSNNQSIIRAVERDQLTGLYNKDFFFNYANQFDVFHKEPDQAR
jgi:PleD family two-component response regulator